MAIYNFKQNTKFYLVYAGLKYTLDVYKDASFSQTFTEESINKRTIHDQSLLFDGAVITKAAPANFSFTIPLLDEDDLKIVFNLLTGYDSSYNINYFDLYAQTDKDVYKLEKCVIESGQFNIKMQSPMSLAISGSASKLSRVGTSGSYTIPGTAQTRSVDRTYIPLRYLKVTIGGATLDYITAVSLSLQNKVTWRPPETLQASLAVTNAANTIYPLNFDLDNRIFTGAIEQYVTDDSYTNVQTWSIGSAITIQAGSRPSYYTLDVNIPSAVYTNRVEAGDLFTQTFDFRMLSNPTALSSVIVYN